MNAEFYAFGEILWDCLPSGRHVGGAPFNVAAHLSQLGASAALISAVGKDSLGDEILQFAREKRVDIESVTRSAAGLGTGAVLCAIDPGGNATYEIVQPTAWDEINVSPQAAELVAKSRGLIFGSLAARSEYNRRQLDRLLALDGPLKFFDVNLRPPFADPGLVIDLAKRADVLKLNDDELGRLTSWLQTDEMTANTARNTAAIQSACVVLAQATQISTICVTRGADGAVLWDGQTLTSVEATKVVVRDTIGAGDAFTAGLMLGLVKEADVTKVLQFACQLGAYVASQDGAIPVLPPEIVALSRAL